MTSLVWKETIRAAVEEAKPYSFGDPQRITEWAELFVEAHAAAPGGLSLEIGTWRGGTALVFLRLLERLYPVAARPMLFTIDPYGDKPYNGGDSPARPALYGDSDYVIMKKLLARFPHHAHFYMTSEEFFAKRRAAQCRAYWRNGQQGYLDGISFVLIDGEHDATTIENDLTAAYRILSPDGLIVIDNVDNDAYTIGALARLAPRHWLAVETRNAALRRPDGLPQQYALARPFTATQAEATLCR